MPVRRSTDDENAAHPLLTTLFWAGVGLAPLAGVLLLVADTNAPLRIAAVLGLTSVVLIGLSIALRRDGGPTDAGVEDRLLDEIAALRHELHARLAAIPGRADAQAAGPAAFRPQPPGPPGTRTAEPGGPWPPGEPGPWPPGEPGPWPPGEPGHRSPVLSADVGRTDYRGTGGRATVRVGEDGRQSRYGERRAAPHVGEHDTELHVEGRRPALHRSAADPALHRSAADPAAPIGRRRAAGPPHPSGGRQVAPGDEGWSGVPTSGDWAAGPSSESWGGARQPHSGEMYGGEMYGGKTYGGETYGGRAPGGSAPGGDWVPEPDGSPRRRHGRADEEAGPYRAGSHQAGGAYRSAARYGGNAWR